MNSSEPVNVRNKVFASNWFCDLMCERMSVDVLTWSVFNCCFQRESIWCSAVVEFGIAARGSAVASNIGLFSKGELI